METDNLFEHCDLHVHTYLSPCARSEMRLPSIVEVCAERGIRRLGITDHIFASTDPGILTRVKEELGSIETPVDVFVGCEADVLAVGRHTVTGEMKSTLDFIAVAANHFHSDTVAQPENDSLEAVGRHFVAMLAYACSLDFADVIAHPMVVFPGTFDSTCLELLTDDQLMEPIELAKENRIAMEISPRALAPDQLFFRARFYGLCKSAGLKFSIGSDAHSLANVGRTRVLGSLIRGLGITDDDIWLPGSAKS